MFGTLIQIAYSYCIIFIVKPWVWNIFPVTVVLLELIILLIIFAV